jgi:hypothetical protein
MTENQFDELPYPVTVTMDWKGRFEEKVDLNKQMFLEIIYEDGRKFRLGCGKILRSEQIVKFIEQGESPFGPFIAKEKMAFRGLEFQGVKSMEFVLEKETLSNWRISGEEDYKRFWFDYFVGLMKDKRQCIFTWIQAPETFTIIFRIEKIGDEFVVYRFMPHNLKLSRITS